MLTVQYSTFPILPVLQYVRSSAVLVRYRRRPLIRRDKLVEDAITVLTRQYRYSAYRNWLKGSVAI